MGYFNDYELECRCGCGTMNISKKLLEKLEFARGFAGVPFIINSACRCPSHNEEVGGSPNSSHLSTDIRECTAVDIRVISHPARYTVVHALLAAGFDRIGIADNFIHADIDTSKSPEVMWTY